MTEATSEASDQAGAPRTAGTILREARQAQGLHIAALAATIKVAQKKLESLEADRLDELPDATFTRALAQTVCRALKIDAAPVLALLPAPAGHRLEHVGEGINAPFRERPGRHEPNDWSFITSFAVWGPLLIVIGAAALYMLPPGWLAGLQISLPTTGGSGQSASEPSGTASASVTMAPLTMEVASAPAVPPAAPASAAVIAPSTPAAPAASAVAPAVPARALQLRTTAPSWVEVHDARSKILFARLVQPGETVDLDGEAPLRLKIGNARATEVVFRGRSLDLAANTRENVARIELK